MAVYVDAAFIPYGRMRMSHMWADSLDELLAMADTIGLQRKWLQKPPKASWVHFDVAMVTREKAIAAGAIEMDKYAASEFDARQKGHTLMVETIAKLRERKGLPADGRLVR